MCRTGNRILVDTDIGRKKPRNKITVLTYRRDDYAPGRQTLQNAKIRLTAPNIALSWHYNYIVYATKYPVSYTHLTLPTILRV